MPVRTSCSTRSNSSASGPLPVRAAWAIAASSPSPASTQIVIWSTVFGNARSISARRSDAFMFMTTSMSEEADAGEQHAERGT